MAEKYNWKQQLYYYVVKRFLLKGVVPLAISTAVAFFMEDPRWVALTPVIQIAEKFVRDKLVSKD